MKTYGIWSNATGKRIAILDTLEDESDFDPTHYFVAHDSTPERVGEIEVEDLEENLDDSFCCQSS